VVMFWNYRNTGFLPRPIGTFQDRPCAASYSLPSTSHNNAESNKIARTTSTHLTDRGQTLSREPQCRRTSITSSRRRRPNTTHFGGRSSQTKQTAIRKTTHTFAEFSAHIIRRKADRTRIGYP